VICLAAVWEKRLLLSLICSNFSSVRPSVQLSTNATGGIYVKFDIDDCCENMSGHSKFLVEFGHLVWSPKYVLLLPEK